jgi:type IV pilus assembly protein PilB
MKNYKKRIGEILIEEGLINTKNLHSAIKHQKERQGKLASILLQMGYVDEKSAVSAFEKQLGLQCVTLEDKKLSKGVLKKVRPDIAKKYCIIPLNFDQKTLTLAMTDPADVKTVDEIAFLLNFNIRPVHALECSIRRALRKYYDDTSLESHPENSPDNKTLEMVLLRFNTPARKKSYPPNLILTSLVETLIEKKIITRAELSSKIRKKLGKS